LASSLTRELNRAKRKITEKNQGKTAATRRKTRGKWGLKWRDEGEKPGGWVTMYNMTLKFLWLPQPLTSAKASVAGFWLMGLASRF